MAKTTAAKNRFAGIRYCSAKKPEPKVLREDINPNRAKLIIQQSNKWANGTTLYYYFFDKKTHGAYVKMEDGTKEWMPWKGSKDQMAAVRKGFRMWEQLGIGLHFKEVKKREEAQIRIAFMEDDGSWSYIGRDILRKRKDPRTMNFGWNVATRDRYMELIQYFMRLVIRWVFPTNIKILMLVLSGINLPCISHWQVIRIIGIKKKRIAILWTN